MNLEDLKTLRDLHQLFTAGIITAQDFSAKKNEILNSPTFFSSDERIKLLQEFHLLLQEEIITQVDFDAVKQKLLNTAPSSSAPLGTAESQGNSSSHKNNEQNSSSDAGLFAGSAIEKTLTEINIEGLNMKITNDKLYISSAISHETFALRSVNGIGIVDLVGKYTKDLEEYKKKRYTPYYIAGFLIIFGVAILSDSNVVGGIILILIGIAIAMIAQNNLKEPTLQSAVRVMLNGTNRDFEFNKKSSQAAGVAKFVALVEDTLTAYHKNN